MNLHEHDWVTPRIAVGSGVWSRDDVRGLLRDGITLVVDCRSKAESFAHLYAGTRITHVHAPTDDDQQRKGAEWFLAGAPLATQELLRGGRVLFHCTAGINRGPSMAYFVMRLMGMEPRQAIVALRAARPKVGLAYVTDAEHALNEINRLAPTAGPT